MWKILEWIKKMVVRHKDKSKGLIPQEDDSRDYLYKNAKVSGDIVSVDLRDKFPIATNQNGYNSCAYHAVCALLDYNLKYKKGYTSWDMNSSEAYGWYYGRLRMGTQTSNSGTILRDAFKVILDKGFVPQTMWDYKNGIYREPKDTAVYAGNIFKLYLKQLKGYYALPVNSSSLPNLLMNVLQSEAPVVFGMPVDDKYQSLNSTNPYVDTVTGSNGFHAQLIVGYFYKDSVLYYIVRNSWGTTFGDNGHSYVKASIVHKLGFDFWCLV